MNWLIFALVGSIAQLIDGSVGMGFGLTSSTFLLTLGTSAALSSAAVHFAELGTTLASGASHWQVNNIDKDILKRLAIPGGIGAFLGAVFLSNIDISSGRIFVSTLLLALGFLMVFRNLSPSIKNQNIVLVKNPRFLSYLGLTGGFLDASGGGGWGPVVTPTLMSTTETETRKIVGTVSASEFIVALSASAGFLLNHEKIDIDWSIVAGLALGGVVMAPIAARIVLKMPKRTLGIVIGVAIIVINGFRILTL